MTHANPTTDAIRKAAEAVARRWWSLPKPELIEEIEQIIRSSLPPPAPVGEQELRKALDEIVRLEKLATKAPWTIDRVKNDGDYGEGDRVRSGFISYSIIAGNNSVVDTFNSGVACVRDDFDPDEQEAFDEVGERNTKFIVACRNFPWSALQAIAARDAEVK